MEKKVLNSRSSVEICHPRAMAHESLLLWPLGHCLPLVLDLSFSTSFDITGSAIILITSALSLVLYMRVTNLKDIYIKIILEKISSQIPLFRTYGTLLNMKHSVNWILALPGLLWHGALLLASHPPYLS